MMFDSPMLDDFRFSCCLLERTQELDGQGGHKNYWAEVETFDVVFGKKSSTDTVVADQDSVDSRYTAYVQKTINLELQDVLRRNDGKIFRVTRCGEGHQTPGTSMLDVKCIELERWELPVDD